MAAPNLLSAATLVQGLLNTPALLDDGEQVAYEVPTNKAVKVATASICNTTGSPVIISVSVVPAGGTPGPANRILANYTLTANNSITQEDVLCFLKGAMLADGQAISINSGTADAINLHL